MNTLPIATQSSTLVFTSTGIERIFTIIGVGTVALLALIGILTIVLKLISGFRKT